MQELCSTEKSVQYIISTEVAVRHPFDGIARYNNILKQDRTPVFCYEYNNELACEASLSEWVKQNHEDIIQSVQAQKEFFSQKYPLATLCGSILQLATMGIQLHSKDTHVTRLC
jgi:hypothetical protein